MLSFQNNPMFSIDTSVSLAQDMLQKKKKRSHANGHKNKKATTTNDLKKKNDKSSKSSKSSSSSHKSVRSAESPPKDVDHLDQTEATYVSPDPSESTPFEEVVSSNREEDISVVTESSRPSNAESKTSCPSKPKRRASANSSASCIRPLGQDRLVFEHSILVDRTWGSLKKEVSDFEETFGEQVLLALMEQDPNARSAMGITSFKRSSKRFDELCQFLVILIDLWVTLCGPEVEEFQDELLELGQQCRAHGIPLPFLSQAVAQAVVNLLQEQEAQQEGDGEELMTAAMEVHEAWRMVLDEICQKMMTKTKKEERNVAA